jgi:hypothetical protein
LGVAVHSEEEMVDQQMKWVRMPSSAAAPVGVVFLVGGVGGDVSRFERNLGSGEDHH